jgi:hypothetical protein
VGELVGFTAPAIAGAALAAASMGAQVAGLVVAGAVEGAVLGLAQASVLVRVLPTVSRRRWVAATAGAAAFAWLLGMLPASTHQVWSDWPVGVVAAVAIPLGLLLLGSIGVAQACALRTWRWRWVALTSAAWCAGLAAFTAVTTPLWQPGQSTALLFTIGLAGGAAMALVMAAVTAQALPRLARLQTAG